MKYNILTVWVPVFYANDGISFLNLRFENDVKMYGTQTIVLPFGTPPPFENDVKMYGTQTERYCCVSILVFENDVKMYGTQTMQIRYYTSMSLRMM